MQKSFCNPQNCTRYEFQTTTGICYVELYQIPTFQVKRALYPTYMQFFENVLKNQIKKMSQSLISFFLHDLTGLHKRLKILF